MNHIKKRKSHWHCYKEITKEKINKKQASYLAIFVLFIYSITILLFPLFRKRKREREKDLVAVVVTKI